MTLYVLFAQRKCHYPGEYAPEVLAAVTEFDYEENPEYLDGKLEEARLDPEFVSAAVIYVTLDDDAMNAVRFRLCGQTTVKGGVRVE